MRPTGARPGILYSGRPIGLRHALSVRSVDRSSKVVAQISGRNYPFPGFLRERGREVSAPRRTHHEPHAAFLIGEAFFQSEDCRPHRLSLSTQRTRTSTANYGWGESVGLLVFSAVERSA